MPQDILPAAERFKKATIEAIVSRGYGNATLAPILERVGLSKGALFHHFRSRDELTAAAFRDLLNETMVEFADLGNRLRAGELTLSGFLSELDAFYAGDEMIATMEVALALRVSPNLAELLRDSTAEWDAFLESFWPSLFELEGVDAHQQREHWILVMDVFRGIGVQHAFGRTRRDKPVVVRRLEETLFAQARVRPLTEGSPT